MKTILVPTDFSEAGRNAARYAVALAADMNYEIILLHVYNLPLSAPGEVPGAMMIDTVQLERDIRLRLKEEAGVLGMNTGVKISCVTATGFVTDEILETEKNRKPAFIVMAIEPSGAFDEFVFGSAATDLLRKVHTPLLIIPEGAAYKRIEKIVFTNDHKITDDLTMDPGLKELLSTFQSKVYVLSVIKNHEFTEAGKDPSEARLHSYFDHAIHSSHFIEHDDIVEGLNEFIDQHAIDLVTMLPHKHNFIENLFKEGITKKMAFHTHIPLLSLSNHLFH